MWHSLEHVHDPIQLLLEAHNLLAPGGVLIVAVPNIDSSPFRWFGPSWYGLDLPRHLTHFAASTLQLMLERSGFQVHSLHTVAHSSWLRCSSGLARHQGSSSLWKRLMRTKTLSRLAASYCKFTSQADCLLAIAER
jgi:hypothetical protein